MAGPAGGPQAPARPGPEPGTVDASPGRLRVGTAGFASAHWAGRFYAPHAKKGDDQLECYQETFSVVEVNSTFYGTPTADTIAGWKRRAARGFEFVLKVPKSVTHEGGLVSDSALAALRLFVERTSGLQPHLALLLFQCPRGLCVNPAQLRRLAAELEQLGTRCRVALELRDAGSAADPELLRLLREQNWALVQHPNSVGRATARAGTTGETVHYSPDPLQDTVTADFVYIRLHGDNDAHTYCFSEAELAGYAEELHRWRARGLDVYCFLLNDTEEAAMPRNAKRLLELVHGLAGEAVPRGPKLAGQRTLAGLFAAQGADKRRRTQGPGAGG